MNTGRVKNSDKPRWAIYRSYLLRMWRVDPSGTCDWRASLEDPRTGERVGFGNLEDLFVFLMEAAESDAADDANQPKRETVSR